MVELDTLNFTTKDYSEFVAGFYDNEKEAMVNYGHWCES